jgi:hypothetical protein
MQRNEFAPTALQCRASFVSQVEQGGGSSRLVCRNEVDPAGKQKPRC